MKISKKNIRIFVVILLMFVIAVSFTGCGENDANDADKKIYYYKQVKIADLPVEFEIEGKHYDIGVAYDASYDASRTFIYDIPFFASKLDNTSYCLIRFDGWFSDADYYLITAEQALEIADLYGIEIPETPQLSSLPFFKQYGFFIILGIMLLLGIPGSIYMAIKDGDKWWAGLLVGLIFEVFVTICIWWIITVVNYWPFDLNVWTDF